MLSACIRRLRVIRSAPFRARRLRESDPIGAPFATRPAMPGSALQIERVHRTEPLGAKCASVAVTRAIHVESHPNADGDPTPTPGRREEHGCLHLVYNRQMTSKDTTTVRVRRPDSERLSALAKSRQTTVVEVVHKALDALERQEFIRGLNVDYQSLDAAAREELLAEQAEWDPLV